MNEDATKEVGLLIKEQKIVNRCLAAGFSLEALMETLRQRPSGKITSNNNKTLPH